MTLLTPREMSTNDRAFYDRGYRDGVSAAEARAESAAQEPRAVALREAYDAMTEALMLPDKMLPTDPRQYILALLDKPHAEALERVRAEEREQCAEAADTYATAWDADPSDDYFKGWIRAAERIAATIRARGEMKKPPAIKPRAS